MKNKFLRNNLLALTFIIASTFTGCGQSSENKDAEMSNQTEETTQYESDKSLMDLFLNQNDEEDYDDEDYEENYDEENYDDEDFDEDIFEESQNDDLTFEDLSELQFEFMSGAGGWSEEFTIEEDGYFTGMYHDSDMGSTGEGYDGGTMYFSSYSGYFTDIVKINDYTYEMTLEDISYDYDVDTEEIKDDILYIYTESYCLGGTDTFRIYLEGTPVSEISEEVYSWLNMANNDETELTMVSIADETNGYGIYSYKRLNPLEDAQMTYNTYKESYDYYNDLLEDANSTLEMNEYSQTMYEFSDECLNYIWNLIKYNTDEEAFEEILEEQRVWISEKEEKIEEIKEEYHGATLQGPTINITLAQMTMERCEELIEYLE